jgi:hypothetical protein
MVITPHANGPWRATIARSPQNLAKKKTEAPETEDLLTTAAKAIGKAAGKVASIAAPAHTDAPARKPKTPKLKKKNKARLPRKVKKAQKKAAARKA